jgi:hypothetical protein
MLSFNRVVKTLFILDFQRMASVYEEKVMICMGVFTSILTVAYVVQEAVVRRNRGLNHFASWYLSIYLGKVVCFLVSLTIPY